MDRESRDSCRAKEEKGSSRKGKSRHWKGRETLKRVLFSRRRGPPQKGALVTKSGAFNLHDVESEFSRREGREKSPGAFCRFASNRTENLIKEKGDQQKNGGRGTCLLATSELGGGSENSPLRIQGQTRKRRGKLIGLYGV